MKTVTFGTLKGGVGKTMLCFNIGGVLAQRGKRILLMDSDLQGNLTNNMGIDRSDANLPTMYDIYDMDHPQPPPENIVVSSPISLLPSLDLLPGSIFLHKAELKLAAVSGRELVLRNYLEDHRQFFSQYEYILLDTNPSMSVVNQNAFVASDSILLVSDVSMNAMEGAQLFIALWEESRRRLRLPDNIKGFIINDFDSRNRLSADFLEYLRTGEDSEDIRAILLDTVIPRNVRITESELAAMPITLYDSKTRGAQAVDALVDELFEKNIL